MQMITKPIATARTVLSWIALLWIILLVSYFLPINAYGINPRSLGGLIGVVASPFLHGSISHLFANSLGLFFLGMLLGTFDRARAASVLVLLTLGSGMGTWLIGRPNSVHVGASGVIYGLMGYLLFGGVFSRNLKAVFVSLVVFFLYGGAVWGVLPHSQAVSWEGHLSGFIAGTVLAWKWRGK